MCWERETCAAVSFRCIIFIFSTSRIHKKHVQLGQADGFRVNKHGKRQPFTCLCLMCISYMRSILGGPCFLGPKAVVYLCLMGKSAPEHYHNRVYIKLLEKTGSSM